MVCRVLLQCDADVGALVDAQEVLGVLPPEGEVGTSSRVEFGPFSLQFDLLSCGTLATGIIIVISCIDGRPVKETVLELFGDVFDELFVVLLDRFCLDDRLFGLDLGGGSCNNNSSRGGDGVDGSSGEDLSMEEELVRKEVLSLSMVRDRLYRVV